MGVDFEKMEVILRQNKNGVIGAWIEKQLIRVTTPDGVVIRGPLVKGQKNISWEHLDPEKIGKGKKKGVWMKFDDSLQQELEKHYRMYAEKSGASPIPNFLPKVPIQTPIGLLFVKIDFSDGDNR